MENRSMMNSSVQETLVSAVISTGSVFLKKTQTPRAVIGTTCVLSMVGSLTIIFLYCRFKKLRTQTRLILMHLSLMDFGVALSNFIGAVVYFDRYYFEHYNKYGDFNVPSRVSVPCQTQAAVAVTCNNSSVLWTVAVAVYLHFRIVTHPGQGKEKFFKCLTVFLFLFCYGMPVLLTVWLLLTHRLGFAPYDSTGWCSLIILSPDRTTDDLWADVFGNDFWVYLAIILIPLLYFSIKIQTRRQYSMIGLDDPRTKSRLQVIDHKFTAIPLIFVLLRIGSVLVSVLFEYSKINEAGLPKWVAEILLYISGIGDSAQGAANGILFVLLTKTARDLIIQKLFCRKSKTDVYHDDDNMDSENSPLISEAKQSSKEKSDGKTLVIIQDT